jgi:hypothetical protein
MESHALLEFPIPLDAARVRRGGNIDVDGRFALATELVTGDER